MPPRRRTAKDTPAKLAKRMRDTASRRRWRVVLLRAKGEILGTVEAPDVASPKAAAAVQFELDEIQRNRIMVQEWGELGAALASKTNRRGALPDRHGTGHSMRYIKSMLRACSRIIAVTAIVAGLSMTAQAADETLTLTCKGTATIRADSPKPYPLSMGLIVNFTTRTVVGTARQRPYVFDDQLQITEWNDVTVIFRGFSQFLGKNISGSMDRMTGDVGMLATSKTEAIDYSLKCTPTRRMF